MKNGLAISLKLGVILLLCLILNQCSTIENPKEAAFELSQEALIKHVNLSIDPKSENWILFKNGTYIIIENALSEKEIETKGLETINEFGPIHNEYEIIELNKTEGWVIYGSLYGSRMRNYIHPKQINTESHLKKGIPANEATYIALVEYGGKKRILDAEDPQIVCICFKGEILRN